MLDVMIGRHTWILLFSSYKESMAKYAHKLSQTARGSLSLTQFQERLQLLGVTNSKSRDKIRALMVSKTLAFSAIILKLFRVHVSILRSPEWALNSLPTDLANTWASSYHLFQKNHRPIQWAGKLRRQARRPLFP